MGENEHGSKPRGTKRKGAILDSKVSLVVQSAVEAARRAANPSIVLATAPNVDSVTTQIGYPSACIPVLDETHDPAPESVKPVRVVSQSVVECGQIDKNGIRRMTAFSPFFGKEVQIYTAVNDPEKRVLYRASALADKFNCATNKIGMYLARRRNESDGIFQASRFKTKPSGRTGLKSGGYFVSFVVCKAFETHYKQQLHRRPRPVPHAQESNRTFSQNPLYWNHLVQGAPSGVTLQQLQFHLAGLKSAQMGHFIPQFPMQPAPPSPLGLAHHEQRSVYESGQTSNSASMPLFAAEDRLIGNAAFALRAHHQQAALQYLFHNQARVHPGQLSYGRAS